MRPEPGSIITANRAGLIPLALDEILLGFIKRHAVLDRAEVVESGLWTVRRCLPVMAAAHARASMRAFVSGFMA